MGKTVLLVDDAATVRLMQRRILEEYGYRILGEAANGMEALEKYKSLKPDVTILDITMPGMDGMVALKYLLQQNNDAKVVMCSGSWLLVNVVEALLNGAAEFVTKPFQRERFLFSVTCALEQNRVLDTDMLIKLSAECAFHEELVLSQDQISELISCVKKENAGLFTVGEILEKLGFLYQESSFSDSKLDKILKEQERIAKLLEQILLKLR